MPRFNYRIFDMEIGTMWRLMPVHDWIGTIDDWIGQLVVIEKVEHIFSATYNDEPHIWIRRYGDVANGRSQMERCAVVIGTKCFRHP